MVDIVSISLASNRVAGTGWGHLQLVATYENGYQQEIEVQQNLADGNFHWIYQREAFDVGADGEYNSVVLDFGGRDLNVIWSQLDQAAGSLMNESSFAIQYLPTQNSNTFAGSILHTVGVDVDLYLSNLNTPWGHLGVENNIWWESYTRLVMSGSIGDDVIYGGNGGDRFVGGEGDDVFNGFDGGDVFDGGEDWDIIQYWGSPEGVDVELGRVIQHGGFAEGDVLINVEEVQGSSFDDILTGNDENNVLKGEDGNDIITGGYGKDTLSGGEGADTFVFLPGQSAIYTPAGGTVWDGRDVITDFDLEDTIDLRAIYAQDPPDPALSHQHLFNALALHSIYQFGDDGVIFFDTNATHENPSPDLLIQDMVVLEDFDVSTLTSDNFMFV